MSENIEKMQFRKELISLIWRWSQESDLTIGDMLIAMHEATATVLDSGDGALYDESF